MTARNSGVGPMATLRRRHGQSETSTATWGCERGPTRGEAVVEADRGAVVPPPRGRGPGRAATVAATTVLAAALSVGAARAQAPTMEPLSCPTHGYLLQGSPTEVRQVDMVTGNDKQVPDAIDRNLNGAGYNLLDDFIYSMDRTVEVDPTVVRLDRDFEYEQLGQPGNWSAHPPLDNAPYINMGDVDPSGRLWIGSGTSPFRWGVIDLAPGSGTYMQVLDSGQLPMPTPPGGTVNENFADWSHNIQDGHLYTVGLSGSTWHTYRFDTRTLAFEHVAPLGSMTGGTAGFGATYADADGFMYASHNVNGRIIRIDMATGADALFSVANASGANDGARCALAPVPVDFGDAPDGYGTTLATDGPRHGLVGFDVTTDTADLMLGATVDVDDDGQPGPGASGDTDDGVADPIRLLQSSPTTVTVTVTNTTASPATLAGWIDLDGSGTFDPTERQLVAVPAGPGTTDHDLTFPGGDPGADTYARFRVVDAGVADPQPTGSLTRGEVEDHPVTLVPTPPVPLFHPAAALVALVGLGGTAFRRRRRAA